MPRQWFIKTKNGQVGPVSSQKLARMARRGKLLPNMGISPDGRRWIKAKRIAELEFVSTAPEKPSGDATVEHGGWYVRTKRGVAGPFSQRRLCQLAKQQRLVPNVAVSRDQVHWIKAKRVPGITFAVDTNSVPDGEPAKPTQVAGLRQRELALTIDGAVFHRQGPLQQMTWFGVGPRVDAVTSIRQPEDRSLPLFAWPPATRQLGLFRAVSPDHVGEERRQLEFAGLVDVHCRDDWRTVRDPLQLCLFERGDASPNSTARPAADDDYPLLRWPHDQSQLRLFDARGVPRSSRSRESSSRASCQLELLPGVRRTRLHQLQLFSVDPIPPEAERSAPEEHTYPLFGWPPRYRQPRLFDPARVDEANDSSGPPSTPQAEPAQQDTERWLRDQWHQSRQSEYLRTFGACSHMARPADPDGQRVDVFIFPASPQRPVTTLVTSGMSNERMTVPPGRWSPRAELVLYVNEVRNEYVNLLYFLAQIPLRVGKALGYGSAGSHGSPPRPIFPDSRLDGYVLMIPNLACDFEMHQRLKIGDDPLQLLWVVPTTQAERSWLAQQGMGKFCELLDRTGHPLALDPQRSCYAAATNSAAG